MPENRSCRLAPPALSPLFGFSSSSVGSLSETKESET
jgi:hypothetical protein